MAIVSKLNSSDSDNRKREEANAKFTAIAKFWQQVQPKLAEIKPYISKVVPILAQTAGRAKYIGQTFIAPHYNDEIGKVLWNVILVFCGGQFALTIMALQAFNMTGSVMIRKSMAQLRESYHEAMANLSKDPQARALLDSNKDGEVTLEEVGQAVIASVTGDTADSRLKSRQLVSVCLKCIDPNKIMDAFTGFLVGAMAIMAILRSQIAKCISIGAQVGQHIASFLRSKTQRVLYDQFPEHRNWVDAGLRSGSALIGVLISFMLVKIVNSFNCALQGAEGLSHAALAFAHKRGKLLTIRATDASVQALTMGLVFVGVMSQVKSGFSCPWYLKLILLPAIVSENLLGLLAVV